MGDAADRDDWAAPRDVTVAVGSVLFPSDYADNFLRSAVPCCCGLLTLTHSRALTRSLSVLFALLALPCSHLAHVHFWGTCQCAVGAVLFAHTLALLLCGMRNPVFADSFLDVFFFPFFPFTNYPVRLHQPDRDRVPSFIHSSTALLTLLFWCAAHTAASGGFAIFALSLSLATGSGSVTGARAFDSALLLFIVLASRRSTNRSDCTIW